MKKIIILSFLFGLLLTLISWMSVKCVAYEEGYWGGTNYHGYPFKYYQYDLGDVVFGKEWIHGTIIWQWLILDILCWFIISLLIFVTLYKLKFLKKL